MTYRPWLRNQPRRIERPYERPSRIWIVGAGVALLALSLGMCWFQNRHFHEPDVSNLKGAAKCQASHELGR